MNKRFKSLKINGTTFTSETAIQNLLLENGFDWLLSCELNNADLEIIDNILYWNSGIFYYGTWKWGVFKSGEFRSGIWQGGIFMGGTFNGKYINIVNKGGRFNGTKITFIETTSNLNLDNQKNISVNITGNELNLIDLDGTLWHTDAKILIIDKRNPEKVILKITPVEYSLITKGVYINDKKRIFYNGLDHYISNELYAKIKQKSTLDLDNIGISLREFHVTELINNQVKNIKFDISTIKTLKNKDITLLTARGSINAHKDLINKLAKTLKEHNINIINYHFLSDVNEFKYKNTGSTAEKKLIKIIEYLTGFRIEENRFKPIVVPRYTIINFYDDEEKNIDICKDINLYISKYINNSDPVTKKRILQLDLSKSELNTNLVTSNNENKFIKNKIKIDLIGVI